MAAATATSLAVGKIMANQFKNYAFRIIDNSAEYPKILQHLRNNYYRDDPVTKMVGNTNERAADLDKRITELMDQNLSFVAVNKEDDSIAGVWVNYTKFRHLMHLQSSGYQVTSGNYQSQSTFHIASFFRQLEKKVNIFDLYRVDQFAEQSVVSVDRKHRAQGLASEMHRLCLDFLRVNNFKVTKGFYTDSITREMAKKAGYEELARIYAKDFEHRNGVKLFPNAEPDQFVSIMALQI